ncbi:hypothetical protein EIP86_003715 [Pleurotus ostreatoroseus]|nr:hypothetical protein EIP86_003715 [Pleurotus ostreatoroseus]
MDRPASRPDAPRKRSWIGKYKDTVLPTPQEGQPLSYPAASSTSATSTHTPHGGGLPFKRSSSSASLESSGSRPTTPTSSTYKRWNSTTSLLTKTQGSELDQHANHAAPGAAERSNTNSPNLSRHHPQDSTRSSKGSSRMSLASVVGGLSALSLTRSREDRGRSTTKDKSKSDALKERARSSSYAGRPDLDAEPHTHRARSQSPFHLRRSRTRDASPTVEALTQSDAESDVEVSRIRPRNAFSTTSDDESGSDDEEGEGSDDEDEWSGAEDTFDPLTEQNTERNALVPADRGGENDGVDIPDPLGEGVNVVIPPEPYFPSTLNSTSRGPRRRKSVRPHDTLPLTTSRPLFQRDRCTLTITHGYPERILEETGRRAKRYVLASDLSEESRYALEWAIGTVMRDGDELLMVTVIENEDKVDPLIPNPADRMSKLRCQQERQGMAYILVRQATSLLQRTNLHVTIACQAWHAKNARHMLLDIVDYIEPVMLIVGSRGLGNLKGILLGSTSHYLIQKCSVPVMVARRRLKRPPRRSAHLAPHRARVSLAEAGIDRVATKVDQDVVTMREQAEREQKERDHTPPPEDPETLGLGDEGEAEGDAEDDVVRKVPGE